MASTSHACPAQKPTTRVISARKTSTPVRMIPLLPAGSPSLSPNPQRGMIVAIADVRAKVHLVDSPAPEGPHRCLRRPPAAGPPQAVPARVDAGTPLSLQSGVRRLRQDRLPGR